MTTLAPKERRYPAARGFSQITRAIGVDPAQVLRHAKLPASYLNGTPRGVTAEVFFRLWDSMMHLSGDPLMAVKLAEAAVTQEVGSPAYRAVAYSPDLLTAIERLSAFKQMMIPARLDWDRTADHLTLALTPQGTSHPIPESFHLTHFAWLLSMIQRLSSQPVSALWTCLPGPPPPGLPAMFGEIRRGPASMTLAMADATRPIASRDDAAWAGAEAELIRDLNAPLSARVRALLRDMLPNGEIRTEIVARELYLSQRTFQRQLAGENTTYQRLLDEVRVEMAQNYLRNTDLSTEEIAFLLAFRDSSSFFRAFQGWTGMTPGLARRVA